MPTLAPGAYLIELQFERPVQYETLSAALEKMGFVRLTPDDTAVDTIGAIAPVRTLGKRKLPTTAAPRATAVRVAPRPPTLTPVRPPAPPPPPAPRPPVPAASAAPTLGKRRAPIAPGITAQAVAAPKPPMDYAAAAIRAEQAGQNPAIINALRAKAGLPPKQFSPAMLANRPATLGKRKLANVPSAAKPFVPGAASASAKAPAALGKRKLKSPVAKPFVPGGGNATVQAPGIAPRPSPIAKPFVPGGVDARAPAFTAAIPPPAETPGDGGTLGRRRRPAAPSDGGGGGGGGGYSTEDPAIYDEPVAADAPAEEEAAEMTMPALDGAVIELWRRWTEWGSPFATGPSISGEDLYRFRFIALLTNPLRIEDRPGQKWLYVRRLSMDPFSELNFNFNPFKLTRGSKYELRFLSRTKAMPSRDDVKQGLVDMGFAPIKLSVMKRNMRVPNRAGNSVTMWFATAVWSRGNSAVTAGDPFFFLNAQEVPQ